ncbi:MAG: GtrA family protein [Microthrixaceae bacterium]
MSLLRRVLAIGVVATLVDVGGLVLAVEVLGWPVVPADAAAVGLATLVSFALHSAWGTHRCPVSGSPSTVLTGARLSSLVADVAVLGLLVWWLDPGWWLPLMIASFGHGCLRDPQLQLPPPHVPGCSGADQSAPACRAAPPAAVGRHSRLPGGRSDRNDGGAGACRVGAGSPRAGGLSR